MIPENVEFRLMTYFFNVNVDDQFYCKLGETLNELTFRRELEENPITEDELVKVGVQLIDEYLNI